MSKAKLSIGKTETADLWAGYFVVRRSQPVRGYSLLTHRCQPKSLAVPSTVIYEMTSGIRRGNPTFSPTQDVGGHVSGYAEVHGLGRRSARHQQFLAVICAYLRLFAAYLEIFFQETRKSSTGEVPARWNECPKTFRRSTQSAPRGEGGTLSVAGSVPPDISGAPWERPAGCQLPRATPYAFLAAATV